MGLSNEGNNQTLTKNHFHLAHQCLFGTTDLTRQTGYQGITRKTKGQFLYEVQVGNHFWIRHKNQILLGVLAHHMTNYINISVQKPGIPGFHRCLKHSQMIWNSILSAKKDKTELHVTCLDLANA